MSINRIGLLFEKLPQLQGLSREIRKHLELQTILTETLPTELHRSATVVASETGELILLADNGAVASKLRQLAPRILKLFRDRGLVVTGIRVQAQVSIRHKHLPRKQIFLSKDARHALLELSSKLKDSPLRSAVEKLGQSDCVSSNKLSKPLNNKKN